MITAGSDGVYIEIHVQPGARRTGLLGRHGDALKVAVGALPVGGKANAAVARLLADLFDVPLRAVSLATGRSARRKRYFLEGVSQEVARKILDGALAATR